MILYLTKYIALVRRAPPGRQSTRARRSTAGFAHRETVDEEVAETHARRRAHGPHLGRAVGAGRGARRAGRRSGQLHGRDVGGDRGVPRLPRRRALLRRARHRRAPAPLRRALHPPVRRLGSGGRPAGRRAPLRHRGGQLADPAPAARHRRDGRHHHARRAVGGRFAGARQEGAGAGAARRCRAASSAFRAPSRARRRPGSVSSVRRYSTSASAGRPTSSSMSPSSSRAGARGPGVTALLSVAASRAAAQAGPARSHARTLQRHRPCPPLRARSTHARSA